MTENIFESKNEIQTIKHNHSPLEPFWNTFNITESNCLALSAKGYTVKSRYLEFDVTIFYKFKLPEVQINVHFG